MNSLHSFIEPLELRQLLSVSAKTLAGPLTAGTNKTYGVYDNGTFSSSYTEKSDGLVSVGGLSDTEIVSTATGGGTTIVNKEYFHQGSKGFLLYKTFGDTTTANSDTKITGVYNPPEVDLPFSLTAKVTQTFSFASQNTVVQTPGGTSHVPITGTFSIELASDKTSPLKVPGGVYDVYTLYGSLKSTQSGQTTKTKSTSYYSPSVGLVEDITAGSTSVIELTHFKHAPKAASAMAITAQSIFSSSSVKKDCLVSDVME